MYSEEIKEALSVFAEYIEEFYPQSRERDLVITKLQEAVFWLTYLDDLEEGALHD